MNNHDPLLTTLNSVRPREPEGWASSPTSQRIRALATSSAEPTVLRPHRRRRRTPVVVGVTGALVLGGGAAVAGALFEADSPGVAACYTSLSAQADTIEADPELVRTLGAQDACATTLDKLETGVDASRLVSCVNEFGGRGVFPVPGDRALDTACASLGWQPER